MFLVAHNYLECSQRSQTADSLWHIQIQELVSGLDSSSSFAAFDKMEEKVLSLEAEAESVQALIGTDSLEGKFKQLECGNVDDELKQYVLQA
jgi:phage shock protein A